MNKLLSDTRLVAAFAAVVIICATVLVALGKVAYPDAIKTIGGFLSGLLLAWQRGTALSEAEAAAVAAAEKAKAEEKKTAIPPILPLLGICLGLLLLPGATCAQAKTIVRSVNDIAADWCVAHYSQATGLSADDALRKFCSGEKALKPWLDLILMGQKQGVDKMGVGHEPECEVTVTKDVASADAGKD